MKIIEFKEPISIQKPFVLCLGFFDGFHLGHQVLIKKAKEFGLPIAIYTFNLSPKQWFLHLEERKFLGVRPKEKEIAKNSTSGGIAYLISKMVIEENGIVFGSAYDENLMPYQNCSSFQHF